MDLILEILSIPLVQSILKIAFIILLFAMPLGTVLTLMERKWSAMIQDRVGPNRANVGNYTGNGKRILFLVQSKEDLQKARTHLKTTTYYNLWTNTYYKDILREEKKNENS